MRPIFYSIFLAFMCFSHLCRADHSCCEKENEDCVHYRAGVQLFFSGTGPEENVEEPRENYEWPGMNEDTFYDYFTK